MGKELSFSDQIDLLTGSGGLVLCLLGVLVGGPQCQRRWQQLSVVFGLLCLNGLLRSKVLTFQVCWAVRRGRWLPALVWAGLGACELVWAPAILLPVYGFAEYIVLWVLLNVSRDEEERGWVRVFVQVLAGCPLGLHGVELYQGFLRELASMKLKKMMDNVSAPNINHFVSVSD